MRLPERNASRRYTGVDTKSPALRKYTGLWARRASGAGVSPPAGTSWRGGLRMRPMKSSRFFCATLIEFLLRVSPDSRHRKPACITKTRPAHRSTQRRSRGWLLVMAVGPGGPQADDQI